MNPAATDADNYFYFSIRFLGSTETAGSASDSHLCSYAQKYKQAEWPLTQPAVDIFDLRDQLKSVQQIDSGCTLAEARQKLLRFGHEFHPTEALAKAAGEQVLARAIAVLCQVYGQNWQEQIVPQDEDAAEE